VGAIQRNRAPFFAVDVIVKGNETDRTERAQDTRTLVSRGQTISGFSRDCQWREASPLRRF
jgi:hypothetical protein